VFAGSGRFVYRRRVPVALAWVVVLAVGLGFGGEVFGRLGGGATDLNAVVDGRDAPTPRSGPRPPERPPT
jgi:hypothetical protein